MHFQLFGHPGESNCFLFRRKACLLGRDTRSSERLLYLTSLVQRFDIRPPEGQKTINVKEHTTHTTAPTHFKVRLIPE